jgi:type II secretory ATPase GspE/PulE/Tfp pilus assembly ATPase PilB-like protein
MNEKTFDIAQFTSYKDCPGQYETTYIRSSGAVKVSENDTTVTVAVAESKAQSTALFLQEYHAPKTVIILTVSDSSFAEFIGRLEVDTTISNTIATTDDDALFSLNAISASSPVVNIINAVCLEAIRRNASDIHIEPLDSNMRIRFRLDGVLHTVKTLPKSLFQSIANRIKIMANLNIMEQRQPQDGRMRVSLGEDSHDFRVSIVPVNAGESIVLRFFNTKNELLTLKELGFSPFALDALEKAVHIPNGLVLATGPTGSGKTTTLHAVLHEMNSETEHIITIEDPIERVLSGINQIQVNYEINLTFDNLLRRILRQDPNVIMVGEIRDTETADLALRAALTGHILLSTLHTNDSISSISRLENMGIEPFLIASVLRYVTAQRLVRKVCPHCKKEMPIPDFFKTLQKKYGISEAHILFQETGCAQCNYTGFTGRTVIGEIFVVDSEIETMISEKRPMSEITSYAQKHGMETLESDAVKKVSAGITTLGEVIREAIL